MFCKKCGKPISKDSDFCPSCGTSIERGGSRQTLLSKTNAKNTAIAVTTYAKIAIVVVAIALLAIGAFHVASLFRSIPALEVETQSVVNIRNIQNEIRSIGELATLEFLYRDVIDETENATLFGLNIPGTQRRFIIQIEGIVKIGIDTSDINVNINERTQAISITIPNARILSHEMDEDSVEFLDVSTGLFVRDSIEDFPRLRAIQRDAMEEWMATETDMFTRAEEDAMRILETLIGAALPEEYTVHVTVR